MSYVTIEVDIDHGRLRPSEPDKLPVKGKGILTVLPENEQASLAPEEWVTSFNELSRNLNLDDAKVQAWLETIRDARG
jgi:hypothetical protein